ncbi:MAG: hypothetical protein GFH27_549287n287 [Chloroflexi bacterium AL-W]|nr:hypothetical protein [Chloroflexi bacterium AL-N1]NOK66561.1 hypothetical protein [Chloroflexi bacterium AL-N10]NOK71949.1 hypothetical protein [Chloroflexi bacterium AL-N5]NOK81206.1 hypothetical protein [Chloroflexi bacterium AL-W]NOK89479.1 hypothetical protein [Chloroflexi bacterium AL-N15]
MQNKPTVSEMNSIPTRYNSSIWSSSPLLHNIENQTYFGRAFVEIWNNDACIVTVGNGLVLRKRTLIALQSLNNKNAKIEDLQTLRWTLQPATGEREGQTFLGRVVVEVWDDETVVGFTGISPQILSRALKELVSIIE